MAMHIYHALIENVLIYIYTLLGLLDVIYTVTRTPLSAHDKQFVVNILYIPVYSGACSNRILESDTGNI
jgi:hypothetical protein